MPKDQKTAEALTPLAELQVLFPIGGKVSVRPPRERANPDAPRHPVKVTMRALTALEIFQQLGRASQIADSVGAGTPIARVVVDHAEDVMALLVVASDDEHDAAWFGALDGGEFLRVVKTFMGANGDFFTEAADLFVGATARKVRAAISAGLMPSSNLPPQASPTP